MKYRIIKTIEFEEGKIVEYYHPQFQYTNSTTWTGLKHNGEYGDVIKTISVEYAKQVLSEWQKFIKQTETYEQVVVEFE